MKNIIFIFFLIISLFYGCNKSNEPAYFAQCEELTDADYKIISDILFEYPEKTSYVRWGKIGTFFSGFNDTITRLIDMAVIHDSTTNAFDGLSKSVSRDRNKPYNENMALRKKLEWLNERCCKIDTSKITTVKTHVITKEDIEEISRSKTGNNYDAFYGKFPHAIGTMSISRPVYYKDTEEGLIYIDIRREVMNGSGDLVWIKKKGDKWVIEQIEGLWKE